MNLLLVMAGPRINRRPARITLISAAVAEPARTRLAVTPFLAEHPTGRQANDLR